MKPLDYKFSLIRYAPDPVKGEFVNIGAVLLDPDGSPERAEVRFTRDWRRAKCLFSDADTERLEKMEQEIAQWIRAGTTVEDRKGMMDALQNSFSTELQMTEAKATLAESMAAAMEEVMRIHVESAKVPRLRTMRGRAGIYRVMRDAFLDGGVWKLMQQNIRAADFTSKGDRFLIDCGYGVKQTQATPDAILRMFQAVSLQSDTSAAERLALSSRRLREGVRRREAAELILTAVVEPPRLMGDPNNDEDESVAQYEFAKKTMEDERIRVIAVSELGDAVKTARRELLNE